MQDCFRNLSKSTEGVTIVIALLFILTYFVYNNGAHILHDQISTTWIKNTLDRSRKFDKECNYSSFWSLPVSSHFSVDFENCQMISSTEDKFQLNLQKMFQEKHFENGTCKLRTAQVWNKPHILTALASYPGSGSTWSRHLIEQLTGIQTSSIYCDGSLRQQEFTGECMKPKEMSIAIKTHAASTKRTKYAFRKAVLIIRNPFDAMIAFYQFRRKGHIGVISEEKFKSAEWTERDKGMIGSWKSFNLSWLKKFNHSVHPLLYENLLRQDTFFYELFKLSEFLNVPVTYQTLWCVWMNREGKFHRKHNGTLPNIARYNPVLKKQVIEAIIEVNDAFTDKFGFQLPFLNVTMTQ